MDEFDRLEPPEVKYRGRSVDELFGEVRSIVNGLPSRQAFEELVLILAAWPEGRRDALPASYLEAVRRWRPLMRMVPSAWYSARRRGEDVPWFGIVGGADIWSHGEAILEDPWCHEYEGWMLRYIPYEMSPDFEDEDDAWVRLGERFGKVEGAAQRELSLTLDAPEAFHQALWAHEASAGLEALDLGTHYDGRTDEEVRRVLRGWFEAHPQLERLEFGGQLAFDVFVEVYGETTRGAFAT